MEPDSLSSDGNLIMYPFERVNHFMVKQFFLVVLKRILLTVCPNGWRRKPPPHADGGLEFPGKQAICCKPVNRYGACTPRR